MKQLTSQQEDTPVYPGVPTFDFGRLSWSLLQYPKSVIFTSGLGLPSRSVFSSFMSRLATPILWQ